MLESERIWWLQTATTGVLEYYIELSSPSWTVKFRAGILYRTLTWVCGVETRTRVENLVNRVSPVTHFLDFVLEPELRKEHIIGN
jgi:hypothetical protein